MTQNISSSESSESAAPHTTSVSSPAPAATPQKDPVVAVILAAGAGTRFDPQLPKQLASVGKREVVDWSIRAFENSEVVSDIVVVANNAVRTAIEKISDREGYSKLRMILGGGKERSDSVHEAVNALLQAGIPPQAKLLIHDASRPFVTQDTITACVNELDSHNVAIVAEPANEPIAITADSGERKVVRNVVPMSGAMRVQTPQAFRFGTLATAYQKQADDGEAASDSADASADEVSTILRYAPSEEIAIVAGSENNMDIVTVHDMAAAESIAKAEALKTVRQILGKQQG
jgi:2-C-methyl-D-erythritol 4-phosphate cytidylyltransferase